MNIKRRGIMFLVFIVFASLSACDNRGEIPESTFVLEADIADSYLSFINPQQTFSSSIYQLIILPDSVIDSAVESTIESEASNAGYSVAVSSEGTEQEIFQGDWSDTTDLDWSSNLVNSHDLDLTSNQNITVNSQCTQACQLYIVKSGYLYQQMESDENLTIQYKIVNSQIMLNNITEQ
jgi:hypothetical protein